MAEEQKGKDFRHIVRILNTDLDGSKSIGNALLKIKGVGFMYANLLCNLAGIDQKKKTGHLSSAEIEAINTIINKPETSGVPLWMMNRRNDPETGADSHLFTTDIKMVTENDIKMLKKVKAYRGMRHAFGLPSRGQKTKSNFRRNKGKVTGVAKRKVAASGK
ncbi:MAG: 30S ribosomal protein S13 [Nanoarchaeota archaeon]